VTRPPRIKKTAEQLLQDCEAHLYLLREAFRGYLEEPIHYKHIAADLRVLVCGTRTNKPILLDLMDEYSFSYNVQPPGAREGGPPVIPQPLHMVGWRDDPVQQRLTEELAEANNSGDESKMQSVAQQLAELARPVPFREWVNSGLAVFIKPYDYSHRELVLAIAQQIGSSHEDESVDEPIVQLEAILIGGVESYLLLIVDFAEQVIEVGSRFVEHMIEHHGYKAQNFKPLRP